MSCIYMNGKLYIHIDRSIFQGPSLAKESFASGRMVWVWTSYINNGEIGTGLSIVQGLPKSKKNFMFPATVYRKNGFLDDVYPSFFVFWKFPSPNFIIAIAASEWNPNSWTCRCQKMENFVDLVCYHFLGHHHFELTRKKSRFATQIYKKNSDILMTLKAYNGRVVLEWLCDELQKFCFTDGFATFDPRTYHIAAALKLCWHRSTVYIRFRLDLDALPNQIIFWSPQLVQHFHGSPQHSALSAPQKPRKHMSRFLGQLEQAGRFLNLCCKQWK